MVDWNTPTNSSTYTNVLTNLTDRDASLSKQAYGSDTNLPTGAIQFDTTTKAFQKWSGSAWALRAGEEHALQPSVTTTGTQPTYVATPTVAWASYVAGDALHLNIHSPNTGSATVNVSTLGAITIKWMGQNLVGGELTGKHVLVYDGTNFNLMNHGGGWATWTPTYGGTGALTFTSVTTNLAVYQRHGSRIDLLLQASGTTGGVTNNGITFTAPVSTAFTSGVLAANINDSSIVGGYAGWSSGTTIFVSRYDTANLSLGAGRIIRVNGSYEV